MTRADDLVRRAWWYISALYSARLLKQITGREVSNKPEHTPFLWGEPEMVVQRLGGRVDELRFGRNVLLRPTLSPSHFFRELATHSELFPRFVEQVDDREGVWDDGVKTVTTYCDDAANAVGLEYLRVSGTVGNTD